MADASDDGEKGDNIDRREVMARKAGMGGMGQGKEARDEGARIEGSLLIGDVGDDMKVVWQEAREEKEGAAMEGEGWPIRRWGEARSEGANAQPIGIEASKGALGWG